MIDSKICKFYAKYFTEYMPRKPFIEDLDWCPISLKIDFWFFSLETERAPGDGFTFGFSQNCWDIVKSDLLRVFSKFTLMVMLEFAWTPLLSPLSSKKDRAIKTKDFQTISLVSSVYKIITNVLPDRLSEVLSDTISENQSAFILDLQILDATFIANEVVDHSSQSRIAAWSGRPQKRYSGIADSGIAAILINIDD